jgi:hypothetical protein
MPNSWASISVRITSERVYSLPPAPLLLLLVFVEEMSPPSLPPSKWLEEEGKKGLSKDGKATELRSNVAPLSPR